MSAAHASMRIVMQRRLSCESACNDREEHLNVKLSVGDAEPNKGSTVNYHAAQAFRADFLRIQLGSSVGMMHAFASNESKMEDENSMSPPRQRTQMIRNRSC